MTQQTTIDQIKEETNEIEIIQLNKREEKHKKHNEKIKNKQQKNKKETHKEEEQKETEIKEKIQTNIENHQEKEEIKNKTREIETQTSTDKKNKISAKQLLQTMTQESHKRIVAAYNRQTNKK